MTDPRITDQAVEAAAEAAWERSVPQSVLDANGWVESSRWVDPQQEEELDKDEFRADIRAALEAALPHLASQPDAREAAIAATKAILYNLPVDGFGQDKRLKEYAAIWGNAAAKAVLALINGGAS